MVLKLFSGTTPFCRDYYRPPTAPPLLKIYTKYIQTSRTKWDLHPLVWSPLPKTHSSKFHNIPVALWQTFQTYLQSSVPLQQGCGTRCIAQRCDSLSNRRVFGGSEQQTNESAITSFPPNSQVFLCCSHRARCWCTLQIRLCGRWLHFVSEATICSRQQG